MNKTYFYTQARTLVVLISLFVLVSSCEENFPVETDDTNTLSVSPSIDSVRAEYNDITQRFFLEAIVSDPQGLLNIDSVTFKAFKTGRVDSLTGALNDSGINGDIIRGDGRFSALLSHSLTDSGLGSFRFLISAYDFDSNAADNFELLLDITNYRPQLSFLSSTDTIAAGDTIFIEMSVSDSNGLADIRKVTYDALAPDSELVQSPSFFFRDDGLSGDRTAGDGIYSVKQPTTSTVRIGIWTFFIKAEDFSGVKSDTIHVPIVITN